MLHYGAVNKAFEGVKGKLRKAKQRKTKLNKRERDFFQKVLREVSEGSRFHLCENFMQHGKTSVKTHCINVAQTAYFIAKKLKLNVNERELIRGALLHDYFMYDWHENNWPNKIHGFTHPRKAFHEASKDFKLSKRERDMILHHMFPLTPCPPRHKEAILLCLADKLCAIKETIHRK